MLVGMALALVTVTVPSSARTSRSQASRVATGVGRGSHPVLRGLTGGVIGRLVGGVTAQIDMGVRLAARGNTCESASSIRCGEEEVVIARCCGRMMYVSGVVGSDTDMGEETIPPPPLSSSSS